MDFPEDTNKVITSNHILMDLGAAHESPLKAFKVMPMGIDTAN